MNKIAYIYTTLNRGGAQKVLLQLADNIRDDVFDCIVLSDSGDLISELKENGIRHYVLPLKDKKPINVVKSLIQIYRLIEKEKIDIIHSHHRYTTVLANIVRIFKRVKVVHTEHNVFPKRNKLNLRGNNIIAVSQKVKESLIKNKVNEKNIELIYNGINVDSNTKYNSIRSELNLSKEKKIVGIIARLVSEKGHIFFIQAVKDILKKHNDIVVIFIGDGPERKIIEDEIDKYKLNDSIILLGNRTDVDLIIPDFDFFVLPSYFEGLPMSILEIMINAKVVLATDVGGNREIIDNFNDGFIISAGNSSELVNIFERCINNTDEIKNMGYLAEKKIKDKFDVKDMINKHKRYYKIILKKC
ncbi:glycosyltransferase involved in cell wall biosynthesis [Clostridium beijerinckii]|uniref:glycosyltransferase n=1 Tax=Clostridium beijerinckii TaxID=1520 RepID=UPI0014945A1D|nr:glycosyltransferase [Clostridium beijerinckii]NOW85439.1 glycosyltransferase involved in cell wall biosynthesis [Clostridium beijerinckii]